MNFDSFFDGLPKKDDFDWGTIYFIVAEEFGWTEEDLLEKTTIPYFLELMKKRFEILKKRELANKRRSKRK